MKQWYKQKTTWTAITGIITSVGGIVTGTLPMEIAYQTIFTSLLGVFLRQGVEKNKF